MNLSLVVATWFQPEWARCIESWNHPVQLVPRMSIVPAYQVGLESLTSDVLGYIHDDLLCLEPAWKERILAEFVDPDVAIVGVAGGYGYGASAMYERTYHHRALGRIGFRSNMVNWERHGGHIEGAANAVILDGMALFVRREFLVDIGGWPKPPVSYFMYTEALCFEALRRKRKIRLVGIKVDHLGGKSTGLNPDLNPDFEGEHRFIYDTYRDVLPARVTP